MFIKKLIIVAVYIFLTTSSFAAVYSEVGYVTINSISAFEDFGEGDIFIETSKERYFFNTSKPGGKNILSILMMALSTQHSVRIWIKSDTLWAGSSAPVYELYRVSLVANP